MREEILFRESVVSNSETSLIFQGVSIVASNCEYSIVMLMLVLLVLGNVTENLLLNSRMVNSIVGYSTAVNELFYP